MVEKYTLTSSPWVVGILEWKAMISLDAVVIPERFREVSGIQVKISFYLIII